VRGWEHKGRLLVPARFFERLGAKVTYEEGGVVVSHRIGNSLEYLFLHPGQLTEHEQEEPLNGDGNSMGDDILPVAPRRGPGGVTYVPLRAVAEELQYTVRPGGRAVALTPRKDVDRPQRHPECQRCER
jgi:hypothetical protein